MRLFAASAVALSLAFAAVLHAQEPCSLLSPAQIGSALGHPMNAGSPGPKNCIWGASDHTSARVYLTLRDPATYHSFKSTAQAAGKITPASGIGDDAFYLGTALYVLKGSHVVLLMANGPNLSQAQIQAAEKTLASSAISSF